ncbi:MAG: dTDP-4-dehydrorhamnose reductase [Pseudomonadota bacterium]
MSRKSEVDSRFKILILGASGLLGNDLIKILRIKHEVIGKDYKDFDITNKEITREKILDINPQIVVNLAGFTNVDGCETEVENAFMVNAEGAKNVALACEEGNIKLIHISTDYVFDGKRGEPYMEDDTPNPLNIYGKSKLKGEEYVKEITEDLLIVRTEWLYGKKGNNFVNIILKLTLVEKELKVVDDQIGSPTYTKDLAYAIGVMLELNLKGVYNITNRGTCSWYQFALKILELAHIESIKVTPVSSEIYNSPAKRPAYSVLNCSKFEKETGFTLRPWEYALAEYFENEC